MENKAPERASRDLAGGDAGLELLLRQLHDELGLNLKQYKPNYLRRRIGVRMRATECADYLQYRHYVKQHPEESRRLINDLTINVTEFFRDQDVYEAIRKSVIPEIIDAKRRGGTYSLRVWSAGCASGEEPYSLSALFLEAIRKEKDPSAWALRITATDLDDKILHKAKEGRYEEVKLLPGMSEGEMFVRVGERYAVRDEIKRPVRFVLLDLMRQPPLRHLDLIVCRNVLIYFEREKQQRILAIFNRCLRKGGFLVLGKSEAIIGPGESGFSAYRRRERIYLKEGEAEDPRSPDTAQPPRKPAARRREGGGAGAS